ncbi:LOW QUALITY PROTEIN: melanoma-associated antigen 10-like [Tamandua tetradactyla]|uniref:LOW QUALITY PROTEIN: melanoma-associated antigen 10-like n=1 Tax=Tamandua tetradactyla TaxID=48850 RepID=UPI004054732F
MPRRQKCLCRKPEEELQAQSRIAGPVGMRVPSAVRSSATSSPSSPLAASSPSFSSATSSSSPFHSSSYCSLTPNTPQVLSAAVTPKTSSGSQRACSSPAVLEAPPQSQPDEGSSCPEEGGPCSSQTLPHTESLCQALLDEKVVVLVDFLLCKYRSKEPVTRAEMLQVVPRKDKDHFPIIFREASKCLQLVFGIDVEEVDPSVQCYVLVTALGLTCDGMRRDSQSMPRTGLLVTILGVIFMEGNRAPEKHIWEALNMMGVYAGRKHFIYGEPRKLLTRDWVRAKYLEYRRVPSSDPVQYEFLWGPRAHAETSKMKILEFWAKVNGSDPKSFPSHYEEALREEVEEEERTQAVIGTARDGTAARARVRSRASARSFL